MQRLLITGGCGFIGTNLVEMLIASDLAEIRVFDNESTGKREHLADWDVEFLHGDLRDAEALTKALAGVDCVVHLAAGTSVMDSIADPETNFAINVVGTMNLLQAMRNADVERIVNASTGGALPGGEAPPPVREDMPPCPESPYGAAKLAVEGYLSAFAASYGMKACSLRFSNVYGPRSFHADTVAAIFFRAILAGRPLVVYGDGSQTRDYVFVEDICRGIVNAVQKRSIGLYQLGTGVPTSLNQLVESIKAIVGPEHSCTVQHEDFRAGEIRHTWCDIGKAARGLDYSPKTALSDGLRRTWEWFYSAFPS